MNASIISVLKNIIEKESKKSINNFNTDMSFTDLGIESMERIRIVIQVEREFGVELSETEASSIETIGDLVKFIETHSEVLN